VHAPHGHGRALFIGVMPAVFRWLGPDGNERMGTFGAGQIAAAWQFAESLTPSMKCSAAKRTVGEGPQLIRDGRLQPARFLRARTVFERALDSRPELSGCEWFLKKREGSEIERNRGELWISLVARHQNDR
jgi:hypothetical protein